MIISKIFTVSNENDPIFKNLFSRYKQTLPSEDVQLLRLKYFYLE